MRNDKRVGIRIREIREAHGLSQAEFAQKIGSNVKTLKNWENRISDPGVECLRAIIEEFHISADDLLGYEKSNNKVTIPSNIPPKDQECLRAICQSVIQVYVDKHCQH